jgi:hypothetical protein
MRELPVEVVEEAVGRILDRQARKEETGNRNQESGTGSRE